jgi:hypothetical protein
MIPNEISVPAQPAGRRRLALGERERGQRITQEVALFPITVI